MAEADKKTEGKPAPAADSWTKWVALTTTILAVGAAFSTMKGGGFSTQTQLNTVKATNNWSYYQSKSIKQTARETERALLLAMQPNAQGTEAQAYFKKEVAACEEKLAQYKEEMPVIKADAEKCELKAAWSQYRGGKFGMAAMFLQIGIMLCAISALLKKKPAWIVGSFVGAAGLCFLCFGWFMLPDEPTAEFKAKIQAAANGGAKAPAPAPAAQPK